MSIHTATTQGKWDEAIAHAGGELELHACMPSTDRSLVLSPRPTTTSADGDQSYSRNPAEGGGSLQAAPAAPPPPSTAVPPSYPPAHDASDSYSSSSYSKVPWRRARRLRGAEGEEEGEGKGNPDAAVKEALGRGESMAPVRRDYAFKRLPKVLLVSLSTLRLHVPADFSPPPPPSLAPAPPPPTLSYRVSFSSSTYTPRATMLALSTHNLRRSHLLKTASGAAGQARQQKEAKAKEKKKMDGWMGDSAHDSSARESSTFCSSALGGDYDGTGAEGGIAYICVGVWVGWGRGSRASERMVQCRRKEGTPTTERVYTGRAHVPVCGAELHPLIDQCYSSSTAPASPPSSRDSRLPSSSKDEDKAGIQRYHCDPRARACADFGDDIDA
ncbi:hypothetical protein R3P38DRAFT_2784005 [Favolaschia claudopus]|uniref:Uncharacterized protein n=1 Tax=Favolaschia claudopus TaxID=2862362 RepID=A0AAW0AWU2_9AGAR